ncbi:hypothetical protein BASA81_002282 [Batrachochytrium salamandrivorans]|nr:hypothetical protein BASA81_002282 [Batrachochytrium salamandrivorans]
MQTSSLAIVGLLAAAAAAVARAVVVYRKSAPRPRKLKKLSLGVDVGGTCMKLALVSSEHGFLVDSVAVNLPESKCPADLLDRLVANTTSLLLKRNHVGFSDLEVVGVCCPGRVTGGNLVSSIANLPNFENLLLGDLLGERIGRPVFVCNDAKSALMGEVWSGSGMRSDNVCMITLGTGVGAAVWADGRLVRGHTGMFGEAGHHIVMLNGGLESASTGVRGIAEEYCSAKAIQSLYYSAPCTPPATATTVKLEAKEILDLAALGKDEQALKSVSVVADRIAALVINCCRMYDPEVVVLGGGLANSKLLVRLVEAAIPGRMWTLAPPSFKLKPASHGNWAGAVGSVNLALREGVQPS